MVGAVVLFKHRYVTETYLESLSHTLISFFIPFDFSVALLQSQKLRSNSVLKLHMAALDILFIQDLIKLSKVSTQSLDCSHIDITKPYSSRDLDVGAELHPSTSMAQLPSS